MERSSLAHLPLRRVASLVQQRLDAGKIDSACGVLRSWLAAVPSQSLQPENMNPRLRQLLVDTTRSSLERAASSSTVSHSSLKSFAAFATTAGDWKLALSAMSRLQAGGSTPDPAAVSQLLHGGNASHVIHWAQRNEIRVDRVMALKVLAAQGSWRAALTMAKAFDKSMKYEENYTAGVLIPYLANGGNWQQAARVLRNAMLQGAALQPAMVTLMLEQTATPATWVGCLALAAMMSRAHLLDELRTTRIYKILVDACPDWAGAIRVLLRGIVVGARPSRGLVASVMARCEEHGRWEEALSVVSLAHRAGFVSNVGPESHRALVASFRASAAWDRAARAVMWMNAAGQAASDAGLPALLDMCTRSGSWEAAAAVGTAVILSHSTYFRTRADELPRVHADAIGPFGPAEDVEVDLSTTYNDVLKALSRGGRWLEGVATLSAMLDDARVAVVQSVCADPVLVACVEAQRWQTSLSVFGSLCNRQPRVVLSNTTCSTALRTMLDVGHWSAAVSVAAMLQRENRALPPSFLHGAIRIAALSGSWVEGLAFCRGLPSHSWRTHDGRQKLQQLLHVVPNNQQKRVRLAFERGRFG
jgi:hypothetical protein